MTKSELIARLAERFPQLVAKDADFAVKMILDAMSEALVRGDRIEIRGFGSFALNYRPPRVGRNPKSGEKVSVPAKVGSALQGRQGIARAGRSVDLKPGLAQCGRFGAVSFTAPFH
jgi:integration host factor subunit beta